MEFVLNKQKLALTCPFQFLHLFNTFSMKKKIAFALASSGFLFFQKYLSYNANLYHFKSVVLAMTHITTLIVFNVSRR